MVQPTSGDDYYAKIEHSSTQSEAGVEKKKIKIVAKKVVSQPLPEKKEAPESNNEYDTQNAVLTPKEPDSPYTPRSVSLPEGGKLDL
ncbi:hypothetical protein H6768_04370 [Candidatus Peribacteria bacterium]|nr:hypothetical protein [Candidatus Peribacteria bacterium]